jgi:DNA-binding PadR family transcriptional regulator
MRGEPVRLFLLAELAHRGPAGSAELTVAANNLEPIEVGTDAIHQTLHRLCDQGLVCRSDTRACRGGAAHSLYRITDEGRAELVTLRLDMLCALSVDTDPFDMALVCAHDVPDNVIATIVDERLRELRVHIASVKRHLRAVRASPDSRVHYMIRHRLARLNSELMWHRNLRRALAYKAGENPVPAARVPR